jgi:hypothetical protein
MVCLVSYCSGGSLEVEWCGLLLIHLTHAAGMAALVAYTAQNRALHVNGGRCQTKPQNEKKELHALGSSMKDSKWGRTDWGTITV